MSGTPRLAHDAARVVATRHGSTIHAIRYGAAPDQEGDLHLPARPHPPVVCLLHGGFWRMPWARDQMTPLACALVTRGFAVWNLEYRRVGALGGGWPGTLDDALAGIAHLVSLAADGIALDLDRVVVVGHSAGGHLALLAAARLCRRHMAGIRPAGVIGLAPVADLAAAARAGLGAGAVLELLGGTPESVPERYAAASPAARLPLGVEQLILHGNADESVPIVLSRRYARAAAAAGDTVDLVELAEAGHTEFLDPQSGAFAALAAALDRWLRPPGADRSSVQRRG